MNPQRTLLLNDTTVLPIKIDNRKYQTTDHYVLSSLLSGDISQDLILSYPVDKVHHVFNLYDQERYRKIVYQACHKFYEKKCRSIQRCGDGDKKKTIGSMTRSLLKDASEFIYQPDLNKPFQSVMGLMDVENVLYGYNIVGLSLLRMKHVVEKLPDLSGPMEYIFWKMHPEQENIPQLTSPKTYRTILPLRTKEALEMEENIPEEEEEDTTMDFFSPEPEEDMMEDTQEEEQGYNPEEVIPMYSDDRVRWIATSDNARLDDLREIGARADFLYTTDAPLTDPFHTDDNNHNLYSRTDPLFIFKIYKAAEYLVGMMRNGMDIKAFINKPVDAILWEGKVSPELFGMDPRSLGPKQRHMIYVEYWNRFMTKSIPYYSLIEKEILYPQNLAGFIRQEHAIYLNERIGSKIKEILFASFVYQVIERSYPHVAPDLRILVLTREMKQFTEKEYTDITDRLYHLFFQGKFLLDDEGRERILVHESYRLSVEEMESAVRFVPCRVVASTPALNIQDTLLDPMAPVEMKMDDKVFHDLYQYIFYRLFIDYGSLTQSEAYDHLYHQGVMMKGDDPRLQKHLEKMIHDKKMDLVRKADTAKFEQYPQVQEIVLYAVANGMLDSKAMTLWKPIASSSPDLGLMKWVVSVIPANSKQHMEKSIHLFAFLRDVVRSLDLMKSIVGRRLQKKSLDLFFTCFYHKLNTIQQGLQVPTTKIPPEFSNYIRLTKTVHDDHIEDLWRMVRPLVFLFKQNKFDPIAWQREARMSMATAAPIKKSDLIQVFAKIANCLYPGEEEVANDHFYVMTQIITGKDDLPMWPDPSFETIEEVDDKADTFSHLPEEIRKRLPKRKKSTKKKLERVPHNLVHPSFTGLRNEIQEAFHRPSSYDPVVSRASYALGSLAAALQNETLSPRRILFFQ